MAESLIDGRTPCAGKHGTTLNCAIIGLGQAGSQADDRLDCDNPTTSHARAVLEHPRLALVAGCDDAAEARQRFAATRPGIPVCASVEALFGTCMPDLVIISGPPSTHAAHCMAAVQAGVRAVLCEKPFVDDLSAGAAVVAACREAGIVLAVNHWLRWSPLYCAVRRFIRERALGRVHTVRVHYSKGALNSGTHAVDLVRFMVGEISHVRAIQHVGLTPAGDDNYAAVLETPCCPAALLTVGDYRDHFTFELDVIGAQGRVLVTDENVRYWGVQEGTRAAGVLSLTRQDCPFSTALGRPSQLALDDIVACMGSAQRRVSCHGADGLQAVAVMETIRRSWRCGGERLSVEGA